MTGIATLQLTPSDSTTMSLPVGRLELAAMAATAVGLRVGLFVAALWLGGLTVQQFAELRDGDGFIHYAQALAGDLSSLSEQDKRLFPGLPAATALLSLVGIPPHLGALMIAWIGVGAAAVLSAVLFRSRVVGWAMAVLTPSYVMSSAMISNESGMLAFSAAGLLLSLNGRPLPGGIAFGIAGIFRPVACFATLGYLLAAIHSRQYRRAAICGASALAVVALMTLLLWERFDEPLVTVRAYRQTETAYAQGILDWPLRSLIVTPFRQPVPAWKVLYVGLHVAVALTACVLAVRKWWCRKAVIDGAAWESTSKQPIALWATPWLLGNTAFVLCVGDQWGFHEFHRFLVPALPPLFWALDRWLPRAAWAWGLVAVASALLAYEGLAHGFPR